MHPDQIGPYRIERRIGAGGMGNVYFGRHTETGEPAAIKVLSAALAREDGFIQRFTREIEALRRLRSRHIVELYDDGSTPDGSWYFAMEYVDGETLTNLISRRRRIPWQEVSDYTLQIAAALKAAHDAGVVHRDIKPSNLMVTSDGTVKLTDFGVAHMFATTRLTRTGGIVGTAEYMSPEQARGQRATKRSDLYSLGAVMYAMLTGRPPFTGSNANEILHKQQYAQIEKPSHWVPELPRLFEDLVCTLLEKKPEHRIPDALVLSRKLQQVRARIDYAQQQQQQQQQTPSEAAPEVSGTGDSVHRPADAAVEYRGPGPATIVRNLIRQEAASQLDKSPVGRFFDNIFVLIGLFVLVVGLGWYLTVNAEPTPEERFAEAQAILQKRPGPAWFRARDMLQELLEEKRLPHEAEQMKLMVRTVDHYDFCRSLQMVTPQTGTRQSEIQRLIRRAFDRFASGETEQARRELSSVLRLVDNSLEDEFLAAFIRDTLEQWKQDTSIAGRQIVLRGLLRDARDAAASPLTVESAIHILESALVLYGNDTSLQTEVDECRRLLNTLRQQAESAVSDRSEHTAGLPDTPP